MSRAVPADELDEPMLTQVVRLGASPPQLPGQPAQGPQKPANTTRTYERRSSTRGDEGKVRDEIGKLMANANSGT